MDESYGGQRAGRWTLLRRLGRGGMAEVWRASDEDGWQVAIKLFRGRTSALETEAAAMASLVHPRIIRILDFGRLERNDTPFLAMELARGPSLDAFTASQEMTWPRAKSILRCVLEGLCHAHSRGIVHRDLKPANIFSADQHGEEWQIGDFGIARRISDTRDEEPSAGTPAFMAPEQFNALGREFGPWTDQYAFGCMIYALTTGEPPFGYKHGALTLALHHAHDPPPPLRARFEVPSELEDYARVLLRKDPFARYQSTPDALLALEALELKRPVSGAHVPLQRDATDLSPEFEPTLRLAELRNLDIEIESEGRPPQLERPPVPAAAPDSSLARYFQQLRTRSTPALGRIRDLPLVGRHEERDELWAAFAEAAEAKERRELWITGERGVGKTVLARWLARTTEEHGHASTYVFRNEDLRRMVARFVRDRYRVDGLSLSRAAHRMGQRANIPSWATDQLLEVCRPHAAMTPDTLDALMAAFTAEARERPLVLRFDDPERSPAARGLIERISHLPRDVGPLIVLVTQGTPDEATEAADLRIDLEPLEVSECAAVVMELTGVAESVARSIADRVAGNPRHAVEVVHAWAANGWLVRSDDRWVVRDNVRPTLPTSIDTFHQAKLSELIADESDHRALQLLALFGSACQESHWLAACENAGIVPSEQLLPSALASIVRLDGERLRFQTPQVRELLVEQLKSTGWEKQLHQAIAPVVDANPSEYDPGTLGIHLLEAGSPGSALPHLLAGAESAHRSDPIRVRELLDRYDEALDLLGDRETERRLQGRLLRLRLVDADPLGLEALPKLESIADSARTLGLGTLECEALIHYTRHATSHSPTSRAAVMGRRAIEVASELGDEALRGRALHEYGAVLGYLGRLQEAEDAYNEARTIGEQQHDPQLLGEAMYGLGWLYFLRGDLSDAPAALEMSAAKFRSVGLERKASTVEEFSGDVYRARGELELAEEKYLAGMAYRERAGRPASEPLLNMAMVELARGRSDDAARWARQAVEYEGRQGRLVIHAAHLVTELIVAAQAEDVPRWDACWERLRERLADSELAHYDLALALDFAARAASEHLDERRAAGAFDRAQVMWLRLERHDEAAALADACDK